MKLDPEKFDDSRASDQETRDEEAAEEVREAIAEARVRPKSQTSNVEGDLTMTSRAERAQQEAEDREREPETPQPQLVKEKAQVAKPDIVKSLRIDFDEATGTAKAVPLTVDGEVAQAADGKDMETLPVGVGKLSWSASTPGVVVTPDPYGLTAKVTAAVSPVRVMGETIAATCQVSQPDGSIRTIGGTSQPFEVVVDDSGKAGFKFH